MSKQTTDLSIADGFDSITEEFNFYFVFRKTGSSMDADLLRGASNSLNTNLSPFMNMVYNKLVHIYKSRLWLDEKQFTGDSEVVDFMHEIYDFSLTQILQDLDAGVFEHIVEPLIVDASKTVWDKFN